MLTKITAYSQWSTVEPLVLNVINRPETDQFEVRNIDGLGAVKATVNTTPLGLVKGSAFSGTSVAERNLVLTLGLDPDWDEWTVSKLRRILDLYFMPEQAIRLVFETMEFSPVEISGYIESNEPNVFSKDSEHVISIICPDPDFRSVEPIVVNGQTSLGPIVIDYPGTIPSGILVEISHSSGPAPEYVGILMEDPNEIFMQITSPVDPNNKIRVSTVPGEKYVHNITVPGGVVTSVLNLMEASKWLTMNHGDNNFEVYSDEPTSVLDWELTYYERFGSL